MININKFKHRDNPSACWLFLCALQEGIDTSCIKISKDDFQYLTMHKYIVRDKKGKLAYNPNDNYNFFEKIDEFRAVFKGLRKNSTGNREIIAKKMLRWLKENDDYNIDDVINFAEQHVNKHGAFARSANNFIYKQHKEKGATVEISPLSDFIKEQKEYFENNDMVI